MLEIPEVIYTIYKYLTDFPINFWFWLMIISPPMLVFSALPHHNFWLRSARLVLAIGLCYVSLNLHLGTEYSLAWKDYQKCLSQVSGYSSDGHSADKECLLLMSGINDTAILFAFLFGYVPAAWYVGVWELLWGVWHRKAMKRLGNHYKGKWLITIVIVIFAPLAIACITYCPVIIIFAQLVIFALQIAIASLLSSVF